MASDRGKRVFLCYQSLSKPSPPTLPTTYTCPFVVQLLSCIHLFVTPWIAACQVSLSFTISWSLLKFMPIEVVILSNHLILCHPLLLLPSIFPSIKVFSTELTLCISLAFP